MNRMAILIDCGKAKGEKELAGTSVDVRILSTWLKSDFGGAWEDDEIHILKNPTFTQILSYTAMSILAEYTLLSFSGHGVVIRDKATSIDSQHVVMGDGALKDFDLLLPKSKRATIICDACREVSEKPINFSESALRGAVKEASVKPQRAILKAIYNSAISNAREGRFTMYGCSVGQVCGDDSLAGGFFTSSLIKCAADWIKNKTGILPMSEILGLASVLTNRLAMQDGRLQQPTGSPSTRSGNDFPFAVSLNY